MKRSLFWILSLLLFVSCLDDKNNYDYKDINDFEGWDVNGVKNIEDDYTLYPDEVLKLEPKVRFSIDTIDLDASYAWYLGSKEKMQKLSDELNYTFTAEKIGEYELIFSATDNKTGVTFSKEVEITVVTPWKNGWIVLSKSPNNESQLSMVLSKKSSKVVIKDGKEVTVDTVIYVGEDLNVVPNLGTGPKKLVENFVYAENTSDLELQSEVMVLQQNRCVELDGNNLTPVSYAENEFAGSVPLHFEPEAAVLSWTAKYLLNQDGQMYISTMSVATDLHSGRYLPDPAFNGKKVKQLLPVFKKVRNFLVVGIGEDNTFFGIMDDATVNYGDNDFTIDIRNYVGSYMELGYNGDVDMSLFKNIDGEYVFHAWETTTLGMYNKGPAWVSILKRGGAYYWHNFCLKAQNPRYKIGDKMVIDESKSGRLDMISDFRCAALLPWKRLLAIVSDGGLHFFDYVTSQKEVIGSLPTFDSEIVDIAVKDYNSKKYNAHLAVALKSGEIYVYEVKYSSYDQTIELVEVYYGEGFGEIVDLEYKFGSGAKPGTGSLY